MSLPTSYFDEMYKRSPDPWAFADRWYEARKYAITVASLPKRRYRRGFEPGCSVGILTAMLAGSCDELLAADVAQGALDAAAERLRDHPGVEIRKLAVPEEWPAGTFDLIVLSELGYYLAPDKLDALVDNSVASLEPGGTLVAVHWRHPVEDYPLGGDEVHAIIRADSRLEPLAHHEEADFQLDVLARPPSVSVAAAEGLVG